MTEVDTLAERWGAAALTLKCDAELVPVYASSGYNLLGTRSHFVGSGPTRKERVRMQRLVKEEAT